MSWANGYMLWLILLLIPMVYYGRQILLKRTQVLIQLGYHGINWFFIEVTSLLVLCTCLIIALAQPRFGYKTIEVEQENRDILAGHGGPRLETSTCWMTHYAIMR